MGPGSWKPSREPKRSKNERPSWIISLESNYNIFLCKINDPENTEIWSDSEVERRRRRIPFHAPSAIGMHWHWLATCGWRQRMIGNPISFPFSSVKNFFPFLGFLLNNYKISSIKYICNHLFWSLRNNQI